jgi:hypothetical protein
MLNGLKKNVLRLILGLVLLPLPFSASANPVVDDFFAAAKVKEKYELSMMTGLEAGFAMPGLSAMPPGEQQKLTEVMEKLKALVLKEVGWEVMKNDFTELYLSTYSEQELKEATKMLNTPTGKMMMQRELDILPRALTMGQDKMERLMPQIMSIVTQAMMP